MERIKGIIYFAVGMMVIAALVVGPKRLDEMMAGKGVQDGPKPSRIFKDGNPENDPILQILKPKPRPPQTRAPKEPSVSGPTPSPAPTVASIRQQDQVSDADVKEAKKSLQDMATITPKSMNGYSRDLFTHWSDLDKNHCDTRADILRRDALQITKITEDGCKPLEGEWFDPFGGDVFTESRALDVDHLIPLALAWRYGAGEWDDDKRESFANDPKNLLAVSASLNRQKGDKAVDAWKPPRKEFWCAYSVKLIQVHDKYALGATASEKSALAMMIGTCPN